MNDDIYVYKKKIHFNIYKSIIQIRAKSGLLNKSDWNMKN